jgi:hypothetical protein
VPLDHARALTPTVVASRDRLRRAALLLVAAVLVATLAPWSHDEAVAQTFDDTDGTIYADGVAALGERDITLGCEEDRFCPHDTLTRAQLASLLAAALDLAPVEQPAFGDTAGNHHVEQINAVADEGLVNGCTDGEFCPSASTTRAQAASLLDRAYGFADTNDDFFADTGVTHAASIDSLAAAGITGGCGRAATDFCPHQSVTRGQFAILLARSMSLIERTDPILLAEREQMVAAEEEAAERAASAAERARIWDALADCESGGNWSINTGNGYYGGLQFSLSSWRAVGGSGYPHQHSKAEQIARGERLQDLQGWGAWPACSRKLGLP